MYESHADETGHVEVRSEQLRLLGLLGYRFWLPAAHLGVVPRLGLGYGEYTVTPKGRKDAAAEAAAQFSRDNLGPLPIAIELELSIAVGF